MRYLECVCIIRYKKSENEFCPVSLSDSKHCAPHSGSKWIKPGQNSESLFFYVFWGAEHGKNI